MSSDRPLIVQGMHGLGDNVHQRAVIRLLLDAGHDIWLRTPWPFLYHDLVGVRLRLVNIGYTLRTQGKNAKRESASFSRQTPPMIAPTLRVWYDHITVRASESFLGGMIRMTLRRGIEGADFRLPVPAPWRAKAQAMVGSTDRPIMVLRPLVDRKEWVGCTARNPDPGAYVALYNAIRERFFVVSVADLAPRVEWLVGPELKADRTFHAGELDGEALAGLMAGAALTFCSPGFAIALSQAVGTPVVSIFGGHERSQFYAYGDRFAPTLGIDPINPCHCFSKTHRCDKRIDLDAARDKITDFVGKHCHAAPIVLPAEDPRVQAERPADRLARPTAAIHESGRAGDSGCTDPQR